jgi:hypothetical protein
MEKAICPECKNDLREVGIQFVESGAYIYYVNLDKDGDINYQLDESVIDDSYYICENCRKFLPLEEEDVIKILKNKKGRKKQLNKIWKHISSNRKKS